MHSATVISFFLTLFALCSIARAAPFPAPSAVNKRYCMESGCRVAVVPSTDENSASELVAAQDPLLTMLDSVISALQSYQLAVAPPPSLPTVPSSSTPATATPTSTTSRFSWFTEIVVKPTPAAETEVVPVAEA